MKKEYTIITNIQNFAKPWKIDNILREYGFRRWPGGEYSAILYDDSIMDEIQELIKMKN